MRLLREVHRMRRCTSDNRWRGRTGACPRIMGEDHVPGDRGDCGRGRASARCGTIENSSEMHPETFVLCAIASLRLCVIVFQFNARAQRCRDAKSVVNRGLHVFCVVVPPTELRKSLDFQTVPRDAHRSDRADACPAASCLCCMVMW